TGRSDDVSRRHVTRDDWQSPRLETHAQAYGRSGVAMTTRPGSQSWFSRAETMIAAVVLVVGLLSVLSLLTYSLSTLQSAEEDLIAREKTKEGLEGVLSARDSAQITFDQIRNISSGGIFVDGFAPIYDPPGPDGIPNTADDSTGANSKLDSIILPGPDGILGTP